MLIKSKYSNLTPEERQDMIRKRNVEYQRKWRKENPEKLKAQQLRQKLNTSKKRLDLKINANIGLTSKRKDGESFYDYISRNWGKIRSKKKWEGREFNIWPNDLDYPELCPILHTPIDYSGQNPNNCWSIDRLDTSKGYISGNVFIISRRANRLKNDGTADEHQKIANWINLINNNK